MKKIYLSLLLSLVSAIMYAQEGGGDAKDIDVNIKTDTGGGDWYASPWVWVLGAAIFILLLVALLRGGGRRTD